DLVLGMAQRTDMHRFDLVLAPAEQPAPGRIHGKEIAVEIRDPEQILGHVPDAVPLLRPPFDFLLELCAEPAQLPLDAVALVLGLFARGDVASDLRRADDNTMRVP